MFQCLLYILNSHNVTGQIYSIKKEIIVLIVDGFLVSKYNTQQYNTMLYYTISTYGNP